MKASFFHKTGTWFLVVWPLKCGVMAPSHYKLHFRYSPTLRPLCFGLVFVHCSLLTPYGEWRHSSGSRLVQAMACCLTTSKHYLNQCRFIVHKVQWHSSEDNFTTDTNHIQCGAVTRSIFLQILTIDIPWLSHEGEPWGIFCESWLWHTSCFSHFCCVFNIIWTLTAL